MKGYCEGCGQSKADLLVMAKVIGQVRTGYVYAGNHSIYPGIIDDSPYIESCCGQIVHCEGCGGLLNTEDIHSHEEARDGGYTETIVDGYACPGCGHKEVI